jgi:hypothetical protein
LMDVVVWGGGKDRSRTTGVTPTQHNTTQHRAAGRGGMRMSEGAFKGEGEGTQG